MSSIQWGDVPTWVTAIATIAAAAGAFITVRIAGRQLRGQREEIQRQAHEQARLIELQTRQLQELDQRAEALRRGQAEQISARRAGTPARFRGVNPDTFESVVVTNGSTRPIRDVRCRFTYDGHPSHTSDTVLPAKPPAEAFADELPEAERGPVRVLRKGDELWFLYRLAYDTGPRGFWLRFTDDAGNAWQLDEDMHLGEPSDTDW